MAEPRPRVLEFGVVVDRDRTAHSDRGGIGLPQDEAWSPEHLLLAGLARCTLTSLEHHARRAGLRATASATTNGTVTRREEDGRFAFVAIRIALDASVEPRPEPRALRELIGKTERDCFVGASLTTEPEYTWTIDGEEL